MQHHSDDDQQIAEFSYNSYTDIFTVRFRNSDLYNLRFEPLQKLKRWPKKVDLTNTYLSEDSTCLLIPKTHGLAINPISIPYHLIRKFGYHQTTNVKMSPRTLQHISFGTV